MIFKERLVPLKVLKFQALLRRLPEDHPKRSKIEGEYAKNKAGFQGEKSIDYYLDQLSTKDYLIFHDLRLEGEGGYFFQIDTLILTSRFAIIIEVKNMIGTLLFDQSFNQLIRTINEKEEVFPDPLLQIERLQIQLRKWLQKFNFPLVPINSFVVISKYSSLIKATKQNHEISNKVIHAEAIPKKIATIDSMFKKELITRQEAKKLSRQLIKQHREYSSDILKIFQLHRSEIMTGVYCSECLFMPLTKERRGWLCPICENYSKDIYLPSLLDYFLLFGPMINNQKAREFLRLPSSSICNKLLSSLNLPSSGDYKNRKYELTLTIFKKYIHS
ncbi:nuclease-related domain-containing protein [Cytobacillus sp. FJAT-54145]|uniref:Nuclease-related domain-containing protein n=1 Tax=Cytobacillus spartinae TaxID=3299023 RepID=A0ABW6KF20_9BACI